MRDNPSARSTNQTDFPKNLRLLCRKRGSISDICQSIGINRQQFNKYMAGTSLPSPSNLQKIAQFFGLTFEQLFLPHAELGALDGPTAGGAVRPGPAAPGGDPFRRFLAQVEALAHCNEDVLRRYEGFYFRYNHTFDGSGRIVRSLFQVRQRDGIFHTHLIERIQHRLNKAGKLTTLKYKGVLMALSGCLFNIEYEVLMRSCIGHAAFPSMPRPELNYIQGIQSSFSSATGRPAASRVVLERIAQPASVRALLQRCGTFEQGDPTLDPHVLALIGNGVPEPTGIFTLHDL